MSHNHLTSPAQTKLDDVSEFVPWALCCTHWRHITMRITSKKDEICLFHGSVTQGSDQMTRVPARIPVEVFVLSSDWLHSALSEVLSLCMASLFPKQHTGLSNQYRWATVTICAGTAVTQTSAELLLLSLCQHHLASSTLMAGVLVPCK